MRSSARAWFECRAGSEAAEKFGHAMDAAGDHGGGEMVRAGDDVGDDFGFGGIRHGRFEDADDGGRARAAGVAGIELDSFADHGGIAVERVGPEAIGEDDGAGGVGAVIVRVEQAAENGVQAHDVEVGAVHDAGADFAGFAEADHAEADGGEVAELADGLYARLQILDFGDGEIGVFDADAGGALADVDEAILVAIDERAEEDAADDAEDGGVGADAESERKDDGDGEAFGAGERAEGNFQIACE